jgi:hypothetical protein
VYVALYDAIKDATRDTALTNGPFCDVRVLLCYQTRAMTNTDWEKGSSKRRTLRADWIFAEVANALAKPISGTVGNCRQGVEECAKQ